MSAEAGEGALIREARKLLSLSLPVMAAQFLSMTMGVVDTLMVGRIGVDALASAAMANAWIYGVLLFGQGFVHGIDPIITQNHGARNPEGVALALQRGIVLAVVVSLPLAGLLLVTGAFLVAVGQDPQLAAEADRYARVQVPSIVCFLVFVAFRQYLQGRGLVRPAMWVILIANLFNAGANWVLIFGHLGFPALGLTGAGIATGLSRLFTLVGLASFIWWFQLHRGFWLPLRSPAFDLSALRRIAALGAPVAIQMGLEVGAFSTGTLLAGRLGSVALAAHTIVLNMAALSFMLPLGISQGAVVRVGNLLGRREGLGARRAAWISVALGAGVMAGAAVVFVSLRNLLPALYTPADDVIALAAAILPIAAVFQVFDGVQVVGCGVLRGMGRTRPAAWFNLVGYWLIGLPFAAFFGLSMGWGLAGIWWGLALGLAVVAVALVLLLRYRGPERAAVYLAGEH